MKRAACALLVALAMLAGTASAEKTIDDFTQGDTNGGIHIAAGSATETESGLASVAGGERVTTLTVIAGAPPREAKVVILDTMNTMAYSNDSRVKSTLKLTYGASAPLRLDLRGESFFTVDISWIDLNTDIILTVSDSNSSASVTKVAAAPVAVQFLFSDFAGIDFGDVQKIVFLFQGDMALDLHVTHLGTGRPDPPDGDGCTYTIGYWKNHPDAWPLDAITLGDIEYTQAEAIALLKTPSKKGDATIILARQLIAAKLNVASGADATDIADTIAAADDWLIAHPVGTEVEGPSREVGILLAQTLDAYNNGDLGPGHCDGQGSL